MYLGQISSEVIVTYHRALANISMISYQSFSADKKGFTNGFADVTYFLKTLFSRRCILQHDWVKRSHND